MIQLNGVQVYYNQGKPNEVHALQNIHLSLKPKDFAAIVGPSGSGKSTLLYVIGGLLRPQSGTCTVNRNVITSMKNKQIAAFRNQEIGFVLQDFGLIRNETVLENVMTPMLFSREKLLSMEKHARNALDMLQIGDLASRKIHQLSGGQSQRVAVARAIVMDPSIILADEPTGALDSENAHLLMEVFQMLNRQGKTIVMVTHNINLCAWCSRTIAISDGKIVDDAHSHI